MNSPLLLALTAVVSLAAGAQAAMPTWTPKDEGPRSWPRVVFTVGGKSITLRCRYDECKPAAKGIANLYTLTEVGQTVDVQVKRILVKERASWSPLRVTSGPTYLEEDYIPAKRHTYATLLSHWKLDSSGPVVYAVQGETKVTAWTDIDETQFNSYDQTWALPPATMITDLYTPPSAPAQHKPGGPTTSPRRPTFWCDRNTGDVIGVPYGQRPPSGYVQLDSQTSSCSRTRSVTAPVVDTNKVPSGPTAVYAGPSVNETKWLEKGDQEALTAAIAEIAKLDADKRSEPGKVVTNKYRALIVENLKPGEESAKYAAEIAKPDATKESIDATLPKKMYGDPGNAVIGPTGPDTPVQLTEDEFKRLKPEAKTAYERDRAGNDGNASSKDAPKFSAAVYDPIALHRVTVAARGTLSGVVAPVVDTTKTPAGTAEELAPPLTPEELALLTPAEKKEYEGMLNAAKADPKNASAQKSLSDLSKKYRDLIKSEGRKPYPPALAGKTDITEKDFDDLQPWQKRQFCAQRPVGAAAISGDQRGAGLGGTGDAQAQLRQTNTRGSTGGSQTSQNQPAPTGGVNWDEKCKGFRDAAPVIPNTRTNITGNVPPGPDAEVKEEKKDPWFSGALAVRGIQGALVGLLIGSLFGPVGLIAGPLIGAALFYGVSKYTSWKASKEGKDE